MPNLIDLLSDEDKGKVEQWKEERFSASTYNRDIPPELYMLGELGYYFGWPAIEAAKRGHISTFNEDGSVKLLPFTMEEMVGLIKAAQKVKYRKMIEEGDVAFSANVAATRKNAGKDFDRMTKPFRERAK